MTDSSALWGSLEHKDIRLGRYQAAYDAAIAQLTSDDASARIWGRDSSLWTQQERAAQEIEHRLGWLDLTSTMPLEIARLQALALELDAQSYTHVLLLGMGGSSLAPEVLALVIGKESSGLELHILDSTVPAQVAAMNELAPPKRTLYIVASKSGTTAETMALYAHFRQRVMDEVGPEEWPSHFVAITDPGTPLQDLAEDEGFRACYLNPPDIGGRFSALSLFGLVPAALMGIDLDELLRRGHDMAVRCRITADPRLHPGLQLGATMGALAAHELAPRDKLTLITSPALAPFGAWAEQLLAESTGKAGVGILPVEGEPVDLLREHYRQDRLCVYLRLDGDDNDETDALTNGLADQGHPVVGLRLRDVYDLGGEFFRWEFSTAVAGAMLGINPFNQPNVEAAKVQARRSLQAYQDSGTLPESDITAEEPPLAAYGMEDAPHTIVASLRKLLGARDERSYLAIMAYVTRNEETLAVLQELRRVVTEALDMPVTLGFGPRFLHSTGQLHKGGPPTGLFLQITCDDAEDMPIPGQEYSLGTLKRAQAIGDLNALHEAGRHVLGLHIQGDPLQGLAEIARALGKAVA
ncbi:MAG: glucose-6-phosphate isomerase [Anaerolineae bacterium]